VGACVGCAWAWTCAGRVRCVDPTAAQRCGGVQLRRMSPTEFERWSSASLDTYAGDLVRAGGGTHDEVRQRARDLFAELMPEGLDTPGTWLMRVLEEGVDVGVLWLGPNPQRPGVVHVFEITIDAEHRGRGVGRAAMLAAEDVVREAGLAEVSLNVFGFNDVARRLYDSLGYRVVSTAMTKTLGAPRKSASSP